MKKITAHLFVGGSDPLMMMQDGRWGRITGQCDSCFPVPFPVPLKTASKVHQILLNILVVFTFIYLSIYF